MFTRRFFMVLAACIVMSVLGAFWGVCFVIAKVLLALLALATAVDFMILLPVAQRLTARRRSAEHMSLDQPNPVTIDLVFRLPDALQRWLRVRTYDTLPLQFDLIGADCMRGTGEFRYNVMPKARGRFELGPLRSFITTRLPGLIRVRRSFRSDAITKVYPTFMYLDRIEMMASMHNARTGTRRLRRPGNSTEFEQIRSYVPGDDVRSINWRATARAVNLMVNTYTEERSVPIIPVLCSGPSMLDADRGITHLDRAASAAVALASSAIRHYDDAGLITLTHKGVDTYLRPQRSSAILTKILEYTCEFGLPPTPTEQRYGGDPDVLPDGIDEADYQRLIDRIDACSADADYDALADYVAKRLSRRSLLVLFANFENLEVARQALPALERIGRRHKLVVVMFENEGVRDVAKGRDTVTGGDKVGEMRFRTLCSHYVEQQQILAAKLRESGINVVYTSPSQLTASVLEKYLELKSLSAI